MALYRWMENTLQIYRDGSISEIVFPEKSCGTPAYSRTGRYIAAPAPGKIFMYDHAEKSFLTIPYKGKSPVYNVRFDPEDRLVYLQRNDLRCYDPLKNETAQLYYVGRTPHNPQKPAVSPGGRYISFIRYRSDSWCLFLYDREAGVCLDYRISLFHYAWLSETQIVYSLMGGLKMLDVQTGKSVTLLRDHRSVRKRCGKEDAEILAPFCIPSEDGLPRLVGLDLLRVQDGRIWFSLDLFGEREPRGIWSAAADGTDVRYCFEVPRSSLQAYANRFLTQSGRIAWRADGGWQFLDKMKSDFIPGKWEQVFFPDSAGR